MNNLSSKLLLLVLAVAMLAGCGSLAKKAVFINRGDDKNRVIAVLGLPGDRQFQGRTEAWQYGETGAGFGYHDYRLIWFYDGKVTGIKSYKSYVPATPASAHFRDIPWGEAPGHD